MLAGLLFWLGTVQGALAVLANAWHIPDNTGDLGFNMRNPEFEIGSNTTVTVYSGIQKFNNSLWHGQPDRRLGDLQGRDAKFLEQQRPEFLSQRRPQHE